uniref:alpha-L-rhamnosidase-related protein n=1 Tax=Mariniphaga sp. TaxID=1954475 RepID=UPI003564222D
MIKNLSVLFLIFALACKSPDVSEPELMKEAVPVWAEGRETEMNLTLGFQGIFQAEKNSEFTLRVTASTLYRVFLNGEFLGYGPARTAHGFFRVDEYDIGDVVKSGENILAIEVAGYNVNTYYTLDQPSFLQVELESDGKMVLATGNNPGFKAFELTERLQKVERYSFQRPFTEYYRIGEGFDDWKTSADFSPNPLKLAEQPGGKLIPRNLLMPEFETMQPVEIYAKGTVGYQKPERYYKDRSLVRISEQFKGYPEPEIEVLPSQLMQEITSQTMTEVSEKYTENPVVLAENEFATFDFGTNLSGFIGSRISCSEPSTIIFHFDEILTEGDVNSKKRMADVNNQVITELEPGTYNLESFESYTFKYLKAIVTEGNCTIEDLYIREYAYPDDARATFASSNPKLNAIYDAARQTYRQNAVDIFMDCPSRERAGWLCDSYFMAIMEKGFTGKSDVAHNFYENYALAGSFEFLPDGMLPMCYPADHNDGVFIPNWALWFIVQIEDYAGRGGDPELIAKLEPRIAALLNYFESFENETGLLEKLNSWIFVEWSRANDFVQDVNYPTNMLYSAALEKAGKLYQNSKWLNKAGKVKQAILEQSFNGEFFVDNAVRSENGELVVTENTTEVCQYYAFFFKIATPESHPDLWKKLITEFGPNRDDTKTFPDVFRANAFIGNYLRMDILSEYGLQSQLLNEIQEYFYSMAEITGTLWENMSAHASCNHGFASYLGHVLYRDVLGISNIDYLEKEVTIRFADIGLDECSGSVPVDDGVIELQWKHSGNQIQYSLNVPEDFTVNVENRTPFELVVLNN